MKKTFLTMMMLCFPAFATTQGNSSEFGAREVHRSSADLPDEIAYGVFLELLDATNDPTDPDSQDVYWHILGEALGYEPHEDRALLRERSSVFEGELSSISEERAKAKEKVLCRGLRRQRSEKELHTAANSLSEVTAAIKRKHYLMVRNALSTEERASFQAYLDKLKEQTTYTEWDSSLVNNPALGGRDITELVQSHCSQN